MFVGSADAFFTVACFFNGKLSFEQTADVLADISIVFDDKQPFSCFVIVVGCIRYATCGGKLWLFSRFIEAYFLVGCVEVSVSFGNVKADDGAVARTIGSSDISVV